MNLTEFLLARIRDDAECAVDVCFVYGLGDYEPMGERVLAECEAKRRIVEEVAPHLEHVEDCAVDGGMYDDTPHALRDLLRLLALPYADHPDYDEAWRS